MNIQPAKRLQSVGEYYFSRKGKEIDRLRAEGHDIISLAIGSPDMPPSEATIERLCAVAQQANAHGYQPTKGTPELRNAIAGFYKRWYGVNLDPAQEVLPLIGSKEGILHVTLAFVNPGDAVLVPDPGYPTYTSLSTLLGVRVIKYPLKPENDWQPDFEALEATDLSDVKLIWTNYPHMPTGAPARRKTYEALVNFAKRHDIVAVNDNPYSFILSRERLSLMQIDGAKDCCIEFNSMSKSHNMPGWRVGMMVSNSKFIDWTLRVKSNVDSGTARFMQFAAAAAMDNTDDWHVQANLATYRPRRIIAEQIMTALGCTFEKNSVGMFLWGRVPDSYADSEELTERVLHEADVFITPGFIFGENGRRYVRISLCAKEEAMQQALKRISQLNLTQYKD